MIRRILAAMGCALALMTGAAAAQEVVAGTPGSGIVGLEDGLSAVRVDGDYGFDAFLAQGGAASDGEVVAFLAENLLDGFDLTTLVRGFFGCSTIAAQGENGARYFGRNFDWNRCDALIVQTQPENGYASISTANMDSITGSVRGGLLGAAMKMDNIRSLAAVYAPLDGMNEAGLAVSVNMIQDSADIDQRTGKPGLTTTTAVRLLLDKAASVDEAIDLLAQYDLHGSMGMMVHFAIADAAGRSVVVEYIDNEMVVTDTPVVTNFYIAEGEKHGIGTRQSHERYAILNDLLAGQDVFTKDDMRDALDSVSKDNFEEFASTEWSIVYDLTQKTARYYHRENYERAFDFSLADVKREDGP